MPLLSILIPAYNASLYLRRCLNSIVSQKGIDGNIEILIIDDGSSDNTLDIIKDYSNKYPFINYKSRENEGIGQTRNELIELSTGKYFWFIDSDDYISINALGTIIPLLQRDDYDMLLFSYIWQTGNKSELVSYPNKQYISGLNMCGDDQYNNSLWTRVYRSSIIKSNNIRFKSYQMGEDFDVIFKLTPYLRKVLSISEPIYHYIANPNSAITNSSKEHVLKSSNDSLLCLEENIKWMQQWREDQQMILRKPLNNFLMGYLYSIFVVPFPLQYKFKVMKRLEEIGYFPINPLPHSRNQRIFSKIINIPIFRTLAIYIDVLLLNIKHLF